MTIETQDVLAEARHELRLEGEDRSRNRARGQGRRGPRKRARAARRRRVIIVAALVVLAIVAVALVGSRLVSTPRSREEDLLDRLRGSIDGIIARLPDSVER